MVCLCAGGQVQHGDEGSLVTFHRLNVIRIFNSHMSHHNHCHLFQLFLTHYMLQLMKIPVL